MRLNMTEEVVQAICGLLESGERAQCSGDFSAFEEDFGTFDATYGRYVGRLEEWVHYVRYFVDCWIDASNHRWRYHDPVTESDWIKIAAQIKQAVENGSEFHPIVLRGRTLDNDY